MMSPMVIVKALAAVAVVANGLQQRVGTDHNLAAVELGNTVPVSEKGYQLVAAQKSNEDMKAFIHRVLAKEARYVKDVAELNGLVGFYSGTDGVQNLETLKKELRAAPWVAEGEGRTAPLNEFGYQKVAKMKSSAHMMAFVRRLLNINNKVCSDEGALNGLVPYYSGELAVQSFDQLTHEVLSAPWALAPGAELRGSTPTLELSEKKKEDPEADEPVETTLATTTTVVTTTLATTTLATTTLATTTLATTTLATTTLATTTLATTTVATTTLPTTTLPEEEEEAEEEALLEGASFVSKHAYDDADDDDDDRSNKKVTKTAKAVVKQEEKPKDARKENANATKESKTNATKGDAKHEKDIASKNDTVNTTKASKAKPAKSSKESDEDKKKKGSWFGWLTR